MGFLSASGAHSPIAYNPALDGVRAVSVLAVVLFHCGLPGAQGGFVGLDIFFVLSGYLITTILAAEHRTGGIDARRFYLRRAFRLYPTLLLVIAAYLGLAPILWPADQQWQSAALAAFYIYDYALAFSTGLDYTIGHTWSLGVEEKFYLIWPLVLPWLLRARRPVVWLLCAFVAITAWRYGVALSWRWQQAYFSFDTRMSGIVLGAILALARPRLSWLAVVVACVALGTVAALPSLPLEDQVSAVTLRITLAELCALVLVCHAAEHANGKVLAWPPLVYVGQLSYGIYLWHFPITLLLREAPLWVRLSGTLSLSFALAALCLHLVDGPIRRWRQGRPPALRRAS